MSSASELHHTRVAAGYKAALHNPRTSAAAKEHARKQLELLEGYTEEQQDEHNTRVLGGFKATLHNPNTSEEAKQHAREVLEAAGVDFEGSGTHSSSTHHATAQSETIGDEHSNRVLGGYKATLHNPNTSEAAKVHAEEVLHREGAI